MLTKETPLNTYTTPANTSTYHLPDRICAVVVAYYPDQNFAARLQIVLPQVETLIVVDNTPGGGCEQQLKQLKEHTEHMVIVENGTNAGIATALNQGLTIAQDFGHKWLLTLDQDTLCHSDIVTTLLQTIATCALNPAVIGANYLDPRNDTHKVPKGITTEWLEQKTVITSGCLVDVAIAKRIGGFRENYFIDQVDHEFCLRVRTSGHSVIIARKPIMIHSVGEPNGPRIPVFGVLPSHTPLRKYYITRNSLVTIADYWHLEPEWCARRAIRLLLGLILMSLLEKHRLAKVKAFAAGATDAMLSRMGPCAHTFLITQTRITPDKNTAA